MAIRNLVQYISFAGIMMAALPSAYAADETAGQVLKNLVNSFQNIPNVASAFAYLMGLVFAVSGIFKFKDHVDNPGMKGETGLSEGIKRFLAGGMMFALPTMSQTVKTSLTGGAQVSINNKAPHSGGGGNDNGVEQMVINFMSDIAQPATNALIAVAYISAIIFLVMGIMRLTKGAHEGPRGPGGFGTIMTFIVAGALFAFADMVGIFCTSLFGDAHVSTYVNIGSNIMEDGSKIAPVIDAMMIFIMLVGFVAFLRGWFVLRAFADGNQQATVAQALTFLIGGALAINMGGVVNALTNSLGLDRNNIITFS